MKTICLTFLVVTAPAISLAQVNRCTIEGETVYQEQPCPGKGKTVNTSGAGTPGRHNSGTSRRRIEAKALGLDADAVEAVAHEKVFIGMTQEAAEISWGRPTSKNTTISNGGRREQWVYRQGMKTNYLYFQNGLLTTIQTY